MAQVLDLVGERAVGFPAEGWPTLQQQALVAASQANDTLELYGAIKRVLGALDDNGHSFALNPAQWQRVQANVSDDAAELQRRGQEWVSLINRPSDGPPVLLVNVPPHAAMDESSGQTLSSRLAEQIYRASARKPCAVIVDLRKTGGGNMWPSLTALRAVVHPRYFGTIVDRHGRPVASYRQLAERAFAADLGHDSLSLGAMSETPLAILIGSGTISASEAIAAFLRARPNSMLIGQSTAGRTTTNELFKLRDGGALVLATGRLTDPNGEAYRGPMRPDVDADFRSDADAVNRALKWFEDFPECRA